MTNRLEAAVQKFRELRRLGMQKCKALAETAIKQGVSVNELEEALKEQESKDRESIRICQS